MFEVFPESDYISMGVCPFCEYRHMGTIGRGKMLALVNHIKDWHNESGERYQHAYTKLHKRYMLFHG